MRRRAARRIAGPAHVAARVQALRDGVKKHGLGAWEKIRTDTEFDVLK